MSRTRRSRLTAGGMFFGAAMVALAAVSAQPRDAAAFEPDDCPGDGSGPICAIIEDHVHCVDQNGEPYCQTVTITYYDNPKQG